MAQHVVIPVNLDTKGVKQGTKSVREMIKSLGAESANAGKSFETAFGKGSGKTAKLVADIQRLNGEIKQQVATVNELKTKLGELQTGKTKGTSTEVKRLTAELKATEKAAEKAAAKMDKAAAEADRLRETSITIGGTTATADSGKYVSAVSEVDRLNAEYQRLQSTAEATRNKLQEATGAATQSEIEKTNLKLQQGQSKLDGLKVKAKQMGESLKNSTKGGELGIEKFGNKVAGLAKRVFVFTVITKALRAIKDLFVKTASADSGFAGMLEQLKASLWALYGVMYQYVMPIVVKITQLITVLAQNAVSLLAKMLGKSTAELMANGKALKKQTQEQKKSSKATKGQVAAFDEVNQVSKDDSDAGGASAGTNFEATQISDGVKSVIDAILLIAGGALFVIGLILLCTGHIGAGLGLMIAGIAILAVELATINWDKMPENIKTILSIILGIVAAATLVLGAILCFTGHLPLGIALLVVSVGSMVAAAALNWDSLKEKLQGTLGVIMGIVGTAFLILGIILCCTGVALPLGLALIVAGAGSLVAVIAANKDTILNVIKSVWNGIKAFWSKYIAVVFTVKFWRELADNIGNGLKAGVKAALNGIIWLANKAIDGLNALLTPVRGIIYGIAKAFGSKVSFSDIAIPHIPKLAKGAVLPANKPFLAQLGDQKNGRNLEAPESLLREIYAEGNAETNSLLKQLIQVMQGGMTVNVDGQQLMRINRSAETRSGQQTVTGGFANAY